MMMKTMMNLTMKTFITRGGEGQGRRAPIRRQNGITLRRRQERHLKRRAGITLRRSQDAQNGYHAAERRAHAETDAQKRYRKVVNPGTDRLAPSGPGLVGEGAPDQAPGGVCTAS